MALGVLHFIKEVLKGVVATILAHKLIKLLALLHCLQLLIAFILYYLRCTKCIDSKLEYKLILFTVECLDWIQIR